MERILLLVDDEENIVAALVRLLRRDGYTILKAYSAAEGLELLSKHAVGVIISDQRMPGMTGSQFLTQAKELYPDTVRIVLSGYTELNSVTDAINRGAIYKFLTKPWDDDLLRENVTEAFLRYEMKMENVRLARELQVANEDLSLMNRNLEIRVQEKTRELMLNINVLLVSQEMLEQLPVAVIGVGEDGLIAVANQMAHTLFSASGDTLYGEPVVGLVPPEMLVVNHGSEKMLGTNIDSPEIEMPKKEMPEIQNPTIENSKINTADLMPVYFWCSQMGGLSHSKGVMIAVNPNLQPQESYIPRPTRINKD